MIVLAGFMNSIGDTLRAERVRRHLDIQDIARELKIPAKFLDAIEKEQFDKLPAAVFARSFVRQYARYLGLHEEDLIDALHHILEPPPSFTEPTAEKLDAPAIQVDRMAEWESVGERRSWSSSLPALALVVVAMLACSGVYAWWQRNRHTASAHEQSVATGQEASAASTPLAARPAPPPVSAEHGVTEPVSAGQANQKAPANPPAAEAAKAAGTAAAEAPAATPGPVHVQVTASALVWVSAKADDKTAFTGTLEPSQSRTVDAQHTVVLRLGNAGGAEILLNGKSIGPVGPSGQPRTIQLTSGGFQIVAPPKPPDLLDPLR
ncbi:MAG TPA: RodZ domain-containing protein [Bryobacteraceae bacterium]|nr:RodZ domain-containing protein [Bryobacteraceae bacterium]